MITYGYAKQYIYSGDGTLLIQVRIPSIHGPYNLADGKGKLTRNYTRDDDLPYYHAVLLPHLPNPGDVVALMGTNSAMNELLVIGLTGGSYITGTNMI